MECIWVYHEHVARWHFACGFAAGNVVADCACGIGQGSAMFANAGALKVNAIDISEHAVTAARRNCASFSTVTVQQADGLNLPFEKNSIDVFVSFETIEHISEDRAFLSEVTRSLRVGGTFICSTPNRSVSMPGKDLSDKPWNRFHVREYSQSEFLSLLGERFFEIRLYGQNPKAAWRVKLLEILGRLLPGNSGGHINSCLKLPRFLYDKEHHHEVIDTPANGACEYLIAVCKKPKRSA